MVCNEFFKTWYRYLMNSSKTNIVYQKSGDCLFRDITVQYSRGSKERQNIPELYITDEWLGDTEWKDYPDGTILDISRVRQQGGYRGVEELKGGLIYVLRAWSCLNDHCTCVALVGNCSLSILCMYVCMYVCMYITRILYMGDANTYPGTLIL